MKTILIIICLLSAIPNLPASTNKTVIVVNEPWRNDGRWKLLQIQLNSIRPQLRALEDRRKITDDYYAKRSLDVQIQALRKQVNALLQQQKLVENEWKRTGKAK